MLSDWKQRVVFSYHTSDWANVFSGVPQGSLLVPLLFLAYINDVDDTVVSAVKKFADDAKIYSHVFFGTY